MRRTSAVLSIAALAGVTLVGCTPAGAASPDCDRDPVTNPDAMSLIEVSGSPEQVPVVDMYTPFTVAENAYADIERGDGPAITDLRQPGVLDITLFDGATGQTLLGTAYSGDVSAPGSLEGWIDQFPGLEDALQCATEGSRVAVALSQDGVSEQARAYYAQFGVPSEGSIVAVVDVRRVLPRAASGQLRFNDGHGLPTVVRAPDGRPGISLPGTAAPRDVVVQTLIEGDGPVLGEQTAFVQYTGVTWEGGEVFDTTWDDGTPAPLAAAQVVPGLGDALRDQRVGSQIMVVVPPDQGYGDQPRGSIPPNSTLVFVVDILALQE
ncbi:FKBP-type peptidyl-prolyl cis-trans isomerase [Microbacterium album]|uniref:peptidylprolyl isomerase n=1 Tax=Microbacterium album TaxID=2053191 RepID=A0A917IBI9_9MICO|nr:FKBP-type peptidyl-prolyl cis-trans isomerase [Microbacterium album]GGH35186.1 peptidylprolyl isomerase [Microbacterium album]